MARPSTGAIKWKKDDDGTPRWHGRVQLRDGSRPFVPLDPRILRHEEERARRCAVSTAAFYREHGVGPDTKGETMGEWFKRFHAYQEGRGLATVGNMRGRMRRWVFPGLEGKGMHELTREDIEGVVARLDRVVAAFMSKGPGAGRLSPSTAVNVWGDLQHALSEAVSAKDPSLRVLDVSPAANVRGPDGGEDRQGQILYSDELVTLLRGEAVEPGKLAVPLYRRRVYAMAVYTKARASELEALTAEDVDLAHGTIMISKQADRSSKGRSKTKATKTKRVRTVDIEPNVRALVEWLTKNPQGKGGRLLHMPPPEDRAELLRRDLRTVGVTREALFIERDPLQRAIVFHDLRDTGLTHMAVRGDNAIVIQWAGGHSDFKTTSGYIERGKVEARRIGAPLPPLPPGLFDGPEGLDPALDPDPLPDVKPWENKLYSATPTGIEPVLPT